MSKIDGDSVNGQSGSVEADQIRSLIVAGDLAPEPAQQCPYLDQICSIIRRLLIPVEPTEVPSLQSEILAASRKRDEGNLDKEFECAGRSARGLIFDCVADAVVGRDARIGRIDIQSGGINTALLRDPYILLSNPAVVDHVADNLAKDGEAFSKELLSAFHNANRRKTARIPIDMQSLLLARHWTDPQLPMWLMSRSCVLNVCREFLPSESWTDSQIKNRLGKEKLTGPRSRPIVAVDAKDDQGRYIEVQILKGIFEKMEKFEFDSRYTHRGFAARKQTRRGEEQADRWIKECPPEKLHAVIHHLEKKYPFQEGEEILIRAVASA